MMEDHGQAGATAARAPRDAMRDCFDDPQQRSPSCARVVAGCHGGIKARPSTLDHGACDASKCRVLAYLKPPALSVPFWQYPSSLPRVLRGFCAFLASLEGIPCLLYPVGGNGRWQYRKQDAVFETRHQDASWWRRRVPPFRLRTPDRTEYPV